MQSIQKPAICALAVVLSFYSVPSPAADTEKAATHRAVIALRTTDFELQETDVGDLAVGESRTVVTDSGKTIDLLRTEDGMEVYVDGALLDTGYLAASGDSKGRKRVELICTAEEECEKRIWIESGEPSGESEQVIDRTIEIQCDDEDECEHTVLWVGENGEQQLDPETLENDVKVRILDEVPDGTLAPGEKKIIVIKHKEQQP